MKKINLKQLIKEVIETNITPAPLNRIPEELKKEVDDILRKAKGSEVPDSDIHAAAEKYKVSPHDLESYIYSLASKFVTGLDFENTIMGGKGDKTNINTLDQNELQVGIAVEMEHTDDENIAKEIASDHISENPKYYSKLVQSGIVDEPEAIKIYNKLFKK